MHTIHSVNFKRLKQITAALYLVHDLDLKEYYENVNEDRPVSGFFPTEY